MKKVYISGPITGYADYNKPAFMEAARIVSNAGFQPINPVYNGIEDDAPWEEHLRADIPMLLMCDCIVMLPGWEKSKGALLERVIAEAFHMEQYFIRNGVLRACKWWTRTSVLCRATESNAKAPQSDESPKPESICQEADRLVSVDRQGQYGHPQEDFSRTANLLSASGYRRWVPDGENNELKHITAMDVGLIMVMVKLSRLIHCYKRDSAVDLAGYAKCISMLDSSQSES